MTAERLTCPYCQRLAVLLGDSRGLYNGRDYGPVYICYPCEAWVGVHKGTTKPLGRLANAELRALKRQVHTVLDPLWVKYWQAYPEVPEHVRSDAMRRAQRGRVYLWLAAQMGLTRDECHVGLFNVAQCERALAIFEARQPTPKEIREWAKQYGEEQPPLNPRAAVHAREMVEPEELAKAIRGMVDGPMPPPTLHALDGQMTRLEVDVHEAGVALDESSRRVSEAVERLGPAIDECVRAYDDVLKHGSLIPSAAGGYEIPRKD